MIVMPPEFYEYTFKIVYTVAILSLLGIGWSLDVCDNCKGRFINFLNNLFDKSDDT